MLYSIGDIHGRYDLLLDLHQKVMKHSEQYDEINTIVMLGDYVDRGPQSKEVIDFLMTNPFTGFKHVYLRGNHEDMMAKSLYGDADTAMYETHQHNIHIARDIFLRNGGTETLNSFGIVNADILLIDKDSLNDIFLPYAPFFAGLQDYYIANGYLFVHAGIEPGIPIEEQNPNVLYWIRGKFLRSDVDHGYLVIHGHTPTNSYGLGARPDVQSNRINIDTGSWSTNVVTAICLDEAHEIEPIFLSTHNDNPFHNVDL